MESSSACSYVATQRGGVALLYEGHRYNKVRDGKDGTVYWRCSRDRQCPGRAVTVNNRVKKSNNKHNHPPEASLMLRNGSHHHNHNHHLSSNVTSTSTTTSQQRYSNKTANDIQQQYSSFLHGSNNNNHNNHGNNNKSSQISNSLSITSSSTSSQSPRIPPLPLHHQQQQQHSPLSSSPLEYGSVAATANNNNNNNNNHHQNFTSALTFLQNLASSNFANNNNNNNSSHSLLPSNNNNNNNLPFINQSSVNDNFSQAMNLSLPNTNNVDNNNALYSSLNNRFNLINNQQNILESSFKMKTNSRTPPPPSASNLLSHHHHNHQLMNKSSYHQYNKLLRNNKYSSSSSSQQQQQQNASKNNNPFDALNRLALSNSPLNTHSSSSSSSMMINMKSNDSPTSRPSSTSSFSMLNTTPTVNDMASNTITCQTTDPLTIQLQDAFQEAHAAAFAAAAFPSLLNETFKFLSATAATNPQMAAALAQTLYNQNLLKNFDLTMATATAAAVVAASNNNNNNNNNENQSDRSIDKCQLNHLSIDHSPFVSLGDNFRSDLDTNFYRRQQQQDQPLNMAVRDKTNILKVLRALMRSAGIQSSDNNAINSEASFHALVVPTSDSHGSEYIAPCDARRQFITDFTGSAGTAVITLNEAALWTDGRYFLQAERELNKQHWILMKQYQPNTPTIGEWLNKVLTPGSRVGVDAHTMSYDLWIKLEQELLLCGNQLIQTPFNLIDQIWTWRPERPFEPVIPLEMKFAGKSFNDKLIEIREKMLKKDAALLVLTALDDIAWLFNLRGSDIDYNPVFFSYAIVSMNRAYLFIDESKLNENSLKHLGINDDDDNNQNNLKSPSTSTSSTRSSPSVRSTNNNNVQQSPQSMIIEKENESTDDPMSSMFVIEIHPYESINEFIRSFVSLNPRDKIWISNKSNYALVNLIPESRRILTGVSPVCCLKAIKNQIELDGMRRAHIKDAVALCELFAWIEDEVKNNNNNNSNGGNNNNTKKQTSNDSKNDIEITDPLSPNSQTSSSSSSSSSTSSSSSSTTKKSCQLSTTAVVDELNVDIKLEELRRKQKDYVGPSFETIAGSGPNSAIIHYKSTEETNRPITMNEMFLLDCGAQFRDGTTDVTRTIHLGQPSAYEKECFTRVLKGHISLAQCRFPRLTKGQFLDAYARRSLWDVGLDYNHGTGHGVGMFLNVHEPPIGISNRINLDDPGLDEHMILSNEPGFYEPNQFGIRIESLVVTKKDNLKYNFNERGYLGFETITLVPIQTKLLDINLLTLDEIKWINDYHQQCRDIVGKELEKQGQIRALEWLLRETSPITVDK